MPRAPTSSKVDLHCGRVATLLAAAVVSMLAPQPLMTRRLHNLLRAVG
jgi:hypothetical protein